MLEIDTLTRQYNNIYRSNPSFSKVKMERSKFNIGVADCCAVNADAMVSGLAMMSNF